ncbi:hypothetical protein NA56DRAFT_572468 [Hyaloscypha hepaticicola]|uniref:Pentatricopeptide repeat domain-containing protein n=1 Tax=Hyaloscypha hepaticicola TaxID=2082293 RepID=A0A2J6Q4P8_9HELO|nr:hypothetical protein NA56DRAFT_572468 [Hyaloscypha hepaticicola]
MGPALQRLLSRPSSLEFLRYLVGSPASNTSVEITQRLGKKREICGRRCISVAAAAREVEDFDVEAEREPAREIQPRAKIEKHTLSVPTSTVSVVAPASSNSWRKRGITKSKAKGQWDENLFTHEQLEFESNLDTIPAGNRVRLLDQDGYRKDWKLWACLLEYRKRIYGTSGVITFWNAIQRMNLHLPTKGILAERFWPEILAVGLHDHVLLEELCGYADKMYDETGEHWSGLSSFVVQHFLVHGQGRDAIRLHNRLFARHPMGANQFSEMCRQVVFKGGDMETLRAIYTQNKHRSSYSRIIPLLCQREDFKSALKWHFFLLKNGDLPSSSKMVEPLVHFLAIYDRQNAIKVTKSLVDAGVSFASSIANELQDNTKISREMMNLVHGKTFNVSVKKYNDSLGARWFATRWVSLDAAINAVHALGVQEIGPLSLQAIALRDPDAKAVVLRLNQLRDLGISVGNSLFSRALENFSKNRRYVLLESLLNSDQHPEALEDSDLQEFLLTSYARAKDWTQYRRTLAIRSLASKSPDIERSNIILRWHVTSGSRTAVTEMLADMQIAGTPVTTKSIAHIIRHTLRPRNRGKRPMPIRGMTDAGPGPGNDLNMVIAILKRIMRSGSFVPILHWREVLRRLGKIGRFDDLHNLCVELAAWYGPVATSSAWPPRRFRVPAQVPTSHHLHPLRMLFDVSLQKAIVEWGFIHNLKRRTVPLEDIRQGVIPITRTNDLPAITSGITLLKQLNHHGVYINGPGVRSAIFNRLITYYGPGRSNQRYNRWAKAILQGKMPLVAKQIDDALGGKYFTGVDLWRIVQARAAKRLIRARRKWDRIDTAKRVPYLVPRLERFDLLP